MDLNNLFSFIGSVGMSNVLSEEKKQQVIALGKLGWPLRRIEQTTGVRRETASAYLKSSRGGGVPARVGTPSAVKTGHRGDHRPRSVKTGHRGDHRLWRVTFGKPRVTYPSRAVTPGQSQIRIAGFSTVSACHIDAMTYISTI